MMDFIYDLYQNDNFVLYLTIALVILVILFVVVLFFGKKDQKLEETKRLQKIELDNAFKEEKELPEKIEVEVKNDDVKEEVPVNNEKKEEEFKGFNPFGYNPQADKNVKVEQNETTSRVDVNPSISSIPPWIEKIRNKGKK